MTKHVLITGATGVIGSALVPLFLKEPQTQVHLMLRATSESHAQQRLGELCTFWQLENKVSVDANRPQVELCAAACPRTPGTAAPFAELHRLPSNQLTLAPDQRLHVYRGDVCQPNLGLSNSDLETLTRQVTHVVHCAGNVKLNQTLELARESAVGSVREILRFCRSCQDKGEFEKLDYVSTVGVAGRMPGLIPERPLTDQHQFRNSYEAAKAEAETVVFAAIDNGLAATIHRPSMVVGDSRSGRILNFQVFYYLSEFLTGRHTGGILPTMGGVSLDIIPVDMVASVIHAASNDVTTAGHVLHLCSGPTGSIQLDDLVGQLRTVCERQGMRLPKLKKVPRRWISRFVRVAGLLGPKRLKKRLQTLPYFLDYLNEPQQFDNRQTKLYLSRHSIAIPPVSSYLNRVVRYYQQIKQTR